MTSISDLRLSKNMKYTALYVAMRFREAEPGLFVKRYGDGTEIKIESDGQKASINGKFAFFLDTHESFVKLECVNRLLSLGYSLSDFSIPEGDGERGFKGYRVSFVVWDAPFITMTENKTAQYKSRLVSGVLEYKTKIKDGDIFDYGLFEKKGDCVLRKSKKASYGRQDFLIEENRVMRYIGKEKRVVVPEGIEEIESSAFWDNRSIEEVILPETLRNMGGDTFYNCANLRKVNIPASVGNMGNNPFAGCPLIEIENHSKNYVYEDGALYTADRKTLIYCSIKGDSDVFAVPEGVTLIGKHAFYLCDRLKKIVLPTSLEKMENNPFSGCSRLEVENHSKAYFIKDEVIYNGFKTAVVGALNRIKSKHLVLLDGIKTINRNSFWNCKGIEEIVLPESLMDIGYNPFVGCSNIHFVSKTPYYRVVDDVLYDSKLSKIVCYPAWKAAGDVHIPDSVIALERGAFSGCSNMTSIHLHNVNIINKSCFTNCSSLKEIHCSDLITYIGEWAFAYCSSLERVSVRKGTIIDNNALSNCPAIVEERPESESYLIESDNIFTLASMQKAYKGRIDSILIDPPYNSHIDYIGYKDGDYRSGYRSFMEERLRLSYPLLSEKGFMVINIDEGEVDELADLCRSVFGQDLVTVHKWKKLHEFFDKNRNVDPNKKVVLYEYIIVCRKTKLSVLNDVLQPYIENGVLKERPFSFPEVFDCFGTTSSAKDEIKDIFGRRDYFSTPKPLKLMKELIRATTNKDSIVMDYFAGSGTVGQACMELNTEDEGNRKFVLVCNSESDICRNVAYKRLAMASKRDEKEFEFLK